MDLSSLISEVRKRRGLWDVRDKEHQNRLYVRNAWEEIGKILQLDASLVKKKWRSLRDNYRLELVKINKRARSGSAATDVYKCKWAYFHDLEFLHDVMTPAKLTGNLRDSPNRETRDLEEIQTEESNSNIAATVEKESNPDDADELPAESTSSNKRSTKRKRDMEEQAFIRLEREKLELLKSSNNIKNDDNYNFLMSFLPHMRKMSPVKNARFRLKMSQILVAALEEDNSRSASIQTPIPSTSWETTSSSEYHFEEFEIPFDKL